MVVPQFLQDSSPPPGFDVKDASLGDLDAAASSDCEPASRTSSTTSDFRGRGGAAATACALFDRRLLYAGQPLHPSAPPFPLHWPPPGQEADEYAGSRPDGLGPE